MKKLALFSMVIALSLMSFTELKVEKTTSEELFSPECFQYADIQTAIRPCGFESYEDEHNYWIQQYEDCENVTDFDEFQFPPF